MREHAKLLSTQGDSDGTRKWFTCAAEAGDVDSAYHLGHILHRVGNVEEAKLWWGVAAHAAYPNANYHLGVLLHDLCDTEAAKEWWAAAANRRDTLCMRMLAGLLATEGDFESARKWLNSAMAFGDSRANEELQSLDRAQRRRLKAAKAQGPLDTDQGVLSRLARWWQQANT